MMFLLVFEYCFCLRVITSFFCTKGSYTGASFGLQSIPLPELCWLIAFFESRVFCSFSLIKASGKTVPPDSLIVSLGWLCEGSYPSSPWLVFLSMRGLLERARGLSCVFE